MYFQIFLLALLACQVLYLHMRNAAAQESNLEERPKSGESLSFVEIVWNYLFNNSVPNYEYSEYLTKKYGSLSYIKFPFTGKLIVNNSDLELAKEIMSSSEWANRFGDDYYIYKWMWGKPLGLLFGNGGYWRESRKLTLKLLHQLDFFRQENVESFILYEVHETLDEIQNAVELGCGHTTMKMNKTFEVPLLNVVYQVMMSKRFEKDDPTTKKWLSIIESANRDFNVGFSVLDLFPWLLNIPFIKLNKSYTAVAELLHGYFEREVIVPRRQAGTYKTDPVDFVDYFLLEIDRRAGEYPRYLTDQNLVACLRDMVFAGVDTTNTALGHGMLHLSLQTQIQERVQAEIDEVIGTRQPRYSDLLNMHYTQAVIWEILRISSPIPVTARSPLNDNEINGERIPKGAMFAVNLYAISRDPQIWSDPLEFQPERFLDEHGELVNLDKLITFGYGKRVCIGESVALTTLFLFLVSMLQKFSFEMSTAHPPPSMKNQMGLSRSPNPYYLRIRARDSSN